MRNKSIVVAMVLGGGGLALIAGFVMMLVSHRSLPQETPGPDQLPPPKPATAASQSPNSPSSNHPAGDPFAASPAATVPNAAGGSKPTSPEKKPSSAPAAPHSPVAAAIVSAAGAAPPPVGTIKVPALPSISGEATPNASDPASAAATTSPSAASPLPGTLPVVAAPAAPAASAALGNVHPNSASGMNPIGGKVDLRGMIPQGSIVMPSLSIGPGGAVQGGPIAPAPMPAKETPKPPSSVGKFRVGEATINIPGQK